MHGNTASNKDTKCSRKLKRAGGYSPVGHVENGVIANTLVAPNVHDITDRGKSDEMAILNEVDEESKEKKKRVPSVKVRLFKRLRSNSNSRASKLEFDADDFDVPVQKVIIKVTISNNSHKLPKLPQICRPKRVAFNPRISRSDWDIHDIRPGGEREEIELLLSRNSKDISIR